MRKLKYLGMVFLVLAPLVMMGAYKYGFPTGATDIVNDTHIDWGTGANQVSLVDLVDNTGNANYLCKDDGDGTYSMTNSLTGLTFGGFSNDMVVTSTGVGNLQTISPNTIAFRTTGVITGKVDIESSTAATLDVAATTHYGGVAANGDADAIEIDLDAAVVGMSILIVDNAGGVITLDPNGTDTIVYNGTAAAAGEAILSSGAKGDFAALLCLTANQWIVLGHDSNGWTEATP